MAVEQSRMVTRPSTATSQVSHSRLLTKLIQNPMTAVIRARRCNGRAEHRRFHSTELRQPRESARCSAAEDKAEEESAVMRLPSPSRSPRRRLVQEQARHVVKGVVDKAVHALVKKIQRQFRSYRQRRAVKAAVLKIQERFRSYLQRQVAPTAATACLPALPLLPLFGTPSSQAQTSCPSMPSSYMRCREVSGFLQQLVDPLTRRSSACDGLIDICEAYVRAERHFHDSSWSIPRFESFLWQLEFGEMRQHVNLHMPSNVHNGMPLSFSHNGKKHQVQAPQGASPGQQITYEVRKVPSMDRSVRFQQLRGAAFSGPGQDKQSLMKFLTHIPPARPLTGSVDYADCIQLMLDGKEVLVNCLQDFLGHPMLVQRKAIRRLFQGKAMDPILPFMAEGDEN